MMIIYIKKRYVISLCFTLLLVGNLVFAQDYTLVWSDEFEGSEVDTNNWSFQIGDGTSEGIPGWGNNELEYYRAENATVDSGYLIITAKEESYGGKNYTSARLRTIHKGDFLYGKFEARIKLPTGQGMWPAFWMLPTEQFYGGWAASGEIDIMEAVNIPTTIYGTIDFGDEWPGNVSSGAVYTDGDTDFSEDFHIYTFEWKPDTLKWYVDGNLFTTKISWWSSGGSFPAPFDTTFHLIVNLAVGGNWPGPPNDSTEFPQSLFVDWIRVYEFEDTVSGIKCLRVPDRFILDQNDPNPFNSSTVITYQLKTKSDVILTIYDLTGREVKTLINTHQETGKHSVSFDASCFESGIYLYKLKAGSFEQSRKMILLR